MSFSSLKGKALEFPKYTPTLGEVKAVINPEDFKKNTAKSLSYAALDIATVSLSLLASYKFLLPLSQTLVAKNSFGGVLGATALWSIYSAITGTLAIGMWVTAHECGHKAFSDNKLIQDTVGYVFHSLMLVPYFSWQRSHALHHANTNHIEDGETHVPPVKGGIESMGYSKTIQSLRSVFGKTIGNVVFGALQLFIHLGIGWPAYLLFGATGGPSRGFTNHFIPFSSRRPEPFPGQPPRGQQLKEMFPGALKAKVWASDIGIVTVLLGLVALGRKLGTGLVVGAYGGPLLVVNAWLVGYTWLQHTDVDVPHLPKNNFNFVKGAFHTIDRPYDKLLWGSVDFLHHHIGSTHVLHHVDCMVPHYNAKRATKVIKEKFPEFYLYESTPIFEALWRVGTKCFQVEKRKNERNEDLYVFVDDI